jgi:ERF superfamily
VTTDPQPVESLVTRLPNLAAALASLQAELPDIERDRTVTVEPKDPKKPPYSYSYVTLANLNKAILPLLAKHGLSFAALPGAGSDGKMCLRYYLMHKSGEMLPGEFPISGEGGIQMIGGRITYARRYCLAALVGVAADEDDESRLSEDGRPATAQRAAARPRQQRPADAPQEGRATAQRAAQRPRGGQPPLPGEDPDGPVGQDQHRHMHALWRDLGYGGDENRTQRLQITAKILGLPDLDSSSDLTRAQADTVIAKLRDRKQQMEQANVEEPPEGEA